MTTRRVIVDHVLFVVSDLEASRRFYTAAQAPVGLSELHVQEDGVHYGADELDDFAIYGGSPATTAAHVAFDAPNRSSVDAFFRAAIAGGGREKGPPGVWTHYSERYHAAFVYDPDGNNVEAVFHSAEPITDAPRTRRPVSVLDLASRGVEGHHVLPRMPVCPGPSPAMSSPPRAGSLRIASTG
jgi:catechol 2,3-dioxygenase-like lactoylglutathione lyase family enzyme